MRLARLFTEHPASVGETYFQHFCAACAFAGKMFAAAVACFIHALFPFVFVTTGSGIIRNLHERMVLNRSRLERDAARHQIDARSL